MKIFQPVLSIILLLIICSWLWSCISSPDPKTPESMEDVITPPEIPDLGESDTATLEMDTTSVSRNITGNDDERIPGASSMPPEGNVAYSFFRKIKKLESKDIRVLIKTNSSAERVTQQLRAMENRELAELENNTDTNTIRTLSILGYESLVVGLVYDTADFEITPVDTRERQKLDTIRGNYWHWQVKAITDKSESRILIVVKAENPGAEIEEKDTRLIPVSIEIDHKNAFRKTWNWVISNPEYSVPSILVPLVIFVVGFRRRNNS